MILAFRPDVSSVLGALKHNFLKPGPRVHKSENDTFLDLYTGLFMHMLQVVFIFCVSLWQNYSTSYWCWHVQVHLNKLECHGKVHLFQ